MIEIQNLSKTYGKNPVLDNISLKIEKGSVYALLGKNGAGKTTLINLMTDLIQPDQGKIYINGKEHNGLTKQDKTKLGVVGEDLALIEELNGFEYLSFVGKIYQLPKTTLEKRIIDLFHYFFDDERDLKKNILLYSAGMKKKIAFCAAVIHTPDILILDEPFSGLDPLVANQMTDFLFSGFLVLAGSHFLRRSIQYSIDFRLSKAGQFISLVIFIMLSIGFIVFDFQLLVISRLLLLVCLLVIVGFIQERTVMENRNKGHAGKRIPGIIPFKLLFNNKKARLPLIIGLLFKAIILASDLYLSRNKGEHLFDGRFVFWLFASPLLIFTYVFNNIWGFWKSIWVNLDIRKGGYKSMIRQGLGLMLLPLSLDILLTLPVLLLSWDNTEFVLLFYFTTIGYLMMLSFLWSLITPEKISSTFQMKGSTSFPSVIASAGGVILLTTMKINPWFYFLIPLLLIGGGIALFVSIDGYNHKKYRIAKSL